jgi:diacylglycerol kinase family enzyme
VDRDGQRDIGGSGGVSQGRHGGDPGLAAFVVNGLRSRGLARLRTRFSAAAAESGWAPPLVLMTTSADGGAKMARQALDAGAAVVFAVGGDGTVRACAEVLAGTGVPLAIVPTGTANLAARSVGVPRELGAALRAGFGGQDRLIDLAIADGTIGVAMAGIGLDAAVVGATPERLKKRAGWPAYAAASAGQLLARPAEFTIRVDGGPELVRRARSVVVGNCGLLPGGFPLLPAARPDDGVLDVAILAPAGLGDWASVGLRVLAASERNDRRLERYRARRVDIRAGQELPRQVDGEMIGPADSLTVAIRPGALVVRVPVRLRPAQGGSLPG